MKGLNYMTMKKGILLITFAIIVMFAGAFLLASCVASPPVQSTAPTATPLPSNAQTATPSITAATNPSTVNVSIANFSFNPGDITVKAGTTVIWTNNDSMGHTIKADAFNSSTLSQGQIFQFKFDTKGVYDYICGIHPSMKGRVTVE